MPVEESVVLVDGPWTHREVHANGARFHLAECGPSDGPLVMLLHGFPEFWWSWRHQLVALGDAGYRVVAPDLRGYGASDKPPREHPLRRQPLARLQPSGGDVVGYAVGETPVVVHEPSP